MTIHSIVFVIITTLSLTAAYALGKPAPSAADEVQQSEEKDSTGSV